MNLDEDKQAKSNSTETWLVGHDPWNGQEFGTSGVLTRLT